MKKRINLLVIFLLLFALIKPIEAYDYALEADKMKVEMVADEKGNLLVTETLEINFNEPGHGIYAEVPQRYNNIKINENSYDFIFPITNIKVLSGQNYELETNLDGFVLKIGDAHKFVEGKETYQYQYEMKMMPWGPKEFQTLYINAISNRWNLPIHHLEYHLEMPKNIDWNPFIYTEHVNKENIKLTTEANTLHLEINETLKNQAVSIEQRLDKDYFKYEYPKNNSYFVLGAFALLTIFTIMSYQKYGKKYPVIRTVEFTAPDNLSSVDLAYVYKGSVNAKDITSLIIFWASLGYLSIEELSKNNILLVKEKEISELRPKEEVRLFNALFAKGNQIETKSLKNKFYTHVNFAQSAIPKELEENTEVFDIKSKKMKVLLFTFLIFLSLGYLIIERLDVVPSLAYALSSNIISTIWLIMTGVVGLGVYSRKNNFLSLVLKILFTFVVITMGYSNFYLMSVNEFPHRISSLLFIVIFVINLSIIANMTRRTKQGTRWYGQALGLKKFIEVAERDRLIQLVEETPTIFYDVLPFAYVLGVTDVWSKKFESIAIEPPQWYRGNNLNNFNSYYLWSSMNRSLSSMQQSMTSVPAPKAQSSGGGNFSGGGFGGGGSAGGGFGGSGGGGW